MRKMLLDFFCIFLYYQQPVFNLNPVHKCRCSMIQNYTKLLDFEYSRYFCILRMSLYFLHITGTPGLIKNPEVGTGVGKWSSHFKLDFNISSMILSSWTSSLLGQWAGSNLIDRIVRGLFSELLILATVLDNSVRTWMGGGPETRTQKILN